MDAEYYSAYQRLNASRQSGMAGPQPIPVSEIYAYCRLAGVDNPDERCKHVDLIQRLDAVYMDHFAKSQKNK